jgi:polyferredoxin
MKRIIANSKIRRVVKILFAAAMLAMMLASFFGVRSCAIAAKIQALPAILALDVVGVSIFIIMALVCGRLYCEILCPLGIVQNIFRWVSRKKVRRVCSRLPESRSQIIVKWIIFVLSMVVGISGFSFMWLDPYGIFGRGVTLTGGIFFIVLLLALVGKGRIWCNWVCPVGTLLQIVSRFAFVKDKFQKCEGCEECRKCIKK